jgi:hypothetical protein
MPLLKHSSIRAASQLTRFISYSLQRVRGGFAVHGHRR